MSRYYHLDIMQKSRSKIRPRWAREQGLALIEVVMTSVVLGIAVVGVALMFSLGQSFTVAQGDTRVAAYLAEQKVEQLQALGFASIPTVSTGCPTATTCYSETGLTAGANGTQTFTRMTTVDCVTKNDLTTAVACPTSPVLKRITVTVQPSMRQADSVQLQTVLVTL